VELILPLLAWPEETTVAVVVVAFAESLLEEGPVVAGVEDRVVVVAEEGTIS
jgi:hypothetical protein